LRINHGTFSGTFSPCGELVLSGSEDGFIHMWNSKVTTQFFNDT